VGLLRAAFRPEPEVCRVRTLMRHRADLVEMASQHVLHPHVHGADTDEFAAMV